MQAVFVVGRLGIFYSSSSRRHYFLVCITSAVYVICQRILAKAAGKAARFLETITAEHSQVHPFMQNHCIKLGSLRMVALTLN